MALTDAAIENSSLDDGGSEDMDAEVAIKSPRAGQRQLTFSAELLEKRGCIRDNAFEPPETGALRVFGVMRIIHGCIATGGHLTPTLYAPREIWFLDRVRLVGLEHKLRLLDVCATQFKILQAMPAPTSADNQTIFDHALHNITTALAESKADLVRPFPNLVPEAHATSHELTKMERDIVNAVGNNTMGKLTSLAFGFGRTLRKQAVAVVERANSAQFETITKDTLGRYAARLSSLFAHVQFLGVWLDPSYVPPTLAGSATLTTEELMRHRAIGHTLESSPRREIVVGLGVFLEEIVVELTLRDIQSLLLSYLQRLSHAFGGFTIDPAIASRPQRAQTT
ncbi:hypothetical protein, variant 2 [Aphanomyces invadans]|uniref:Uncharacterized protein n=1 Tax=Aphanomyces invadans TaxID=157072 RepID=A0A024TXH4_9STRA|nr:hypothetical protein, variant 1 [Aphanomyces invadans]XP_008873202.1 hypothetical protein, variant 2 [Aphanomyces invadans]ETV98326.1 hypothetical protein, variant 1 [Aphanomyces invadans]ETV98327.1 hypothetical protein, variant 2 [Aphanomyces invadans]|eukprot:XP_008873201.1 hypothetical protein, variant 1 [Aphanomyces invadans]